MNLPLPIGEVILGWVLVLQKRNYGIPIIDLLNVGSGELHSVYQCNAFNQFNTETHGTALGSRHRPQVVSIDIFGRK